MHNIKYLSTVLQRHSRGVLLQVKGDCPDPVHSDQMVLRTVRREAGPHLRWLKALKNQGSSKRISGSSPLRSAGSRDGQVGGCT